MCIAAVIFIFFAALSGAIAFGGLYGKPWYIKIYFTVVYRDRGHRHLTENKDLQLWVQIQAAHASNFLNPDCKKIT